MRRLRTFVKGSATVLAVIAILVVSVITFVLWTNPGQRFLCGFIERTLKESYGLELSIGELDVSLLPLRVQVGRLVVLGGDERPFAQIERASVTLDGSALVRGNIILDDIQVLNPQLRLALSSTGEIVNLPRLQLPEDDGRDDDAEDRGASLHLRHARLRGGQVEVEVSQVLDQPLTVEIRDLESTVRGAENGVLDLVLGGVGRITFGENIHDLHELSLMARMAPEGLDLHSARVHLGELDLRVEEGSLTTTEPFDATARATLALDLSMLGQLPLGTPELGGSLQVEAQFSRSEGRNTARVHLNGNALDLNLSPSSDTEPSPETLAHNQGNGPLGNLVAEVHYDGERVMVPRLRVETGGGFVQADRVSLDLTEPGFPLLAHLEIEDVDLGQVVQALGIDDIGVDLGLAGVIDMQGTLSPVALRVNSLSLDARELSIDALRSTEAGTATSAGQLAQARLEGNLTIGSSGADIERLELFVGEGKRLTSALVINGKAPFSAETPVRLAGATPHSGIELAPIGRFLGQQIAGRTRLTANLAGTYTDLEARGELTVRGLATSGVRIDDARGSLHYRKNVIRIPRLHAALGKSLVRAEETLIELGSGSPGTAGFRPLKARTRISFDPVELVDVVGFSGVGDPVEQLRGTLRGAAAVELVGDVSGLRAEVKAHIPNLAFAQQGKNIGDVRVDVGYRAGDIEVRQLEVRQRGGNAAVTGTVKRSGELDLRADITNFDLSRFQKVLPDEMELQSFLDVSAVISGTHTEPRGQGKIGVRHTSVYGVPLQDTDLTWSSDGEMVRLAGQIAGEMVDIDTLVLGLSPPHPIRLRASLALESVADLLPEGMIPQDFDGAVRGLVEIEGAATDAASLRGSFALNELMVEAADFRVRTRSPLLLRLEGGELRLSGASFAVASTTTSPEAVGALVTIPGLRLGLDSPHPLRLRAKAQLVDLTQLLGSERAPEGLAASVETRIGINGELSNIPDIRGVVTIDRLEARQGELNLRAPRSLSVTLARGTIRLAPAQLVVGPVGSTNPGDITVGGTVSAEQMDVTLTGLLSLQAFQPLVDSVDRLEGRVIVDCQIIGSPSNPQILGEARVDGFGVVLPELSGGISQGSGEVRFSRNVVLLERFEARVLGGRSLVTGRVELEGAGLGTYHLDVNLNDARYRLGPESSVVLNTDIAVDSPTEGEVLPLISGLVEVSRFRYNDPIRLGLNVENAAGAVAGRLRPRRTSVRTIADPVVRLDIQVSERGNLSIDNNLLEARIHLDEGAQIFRVVGTDAALGLLGTVRVERESKVMFRGTEFEVSRGFLRFQRRNEIEAALDVTATTELRDWEITLRASGTTSAPRIELSSEPTLDETDIILLLTVGMTQAELQDSGSSGLIFDMLTRGLDERVEDAIPFFDTFRITSDYSRRAGRATPVVYAGRDLRENLELGVATSVSTDREVSVTLEYQVLDWLGLEAVYSNAEESMMGDLGGDVTLRWEFESRAARRREREAESRAGQDRRPPASERSRVPDRTP